LWVWQWDYNNKQFIYKAMKIRTIISGTVCLLTLASCNDELDYNEFNNYDKDYVFTDFSNTVGFVTNIYGKLDYDFGSYGNGMLASACDESEYAWRAGSVNDFTDGAWSPSNAKGDVWSNSYAAIREANYYLNTCDQCDFSQYKFNQDYTAQMSRFKRLKFEVRFLRAYYYFNLVRQYGAVPFTTKVLTEDEANALERTPANDVFKFIVDECNAICDSLPADYSKLGNDAAANETGRASKLAVLALKARTLLYQASPLFNESIDNERWHQAALASKAVIDSCGKYGVKLDKYSALWGVDNWKSSEMIFVRRIGDLNSLEANNFPIGVEGGNSGNCPTQTLVDAYGMKSTGKQWNEEGSGYDAAKPYDNRDPRLGMTIALNGDKGWPTYNSTPLQTYYGGVNGEPIAGATPTGYYLKKYLDASVNVSATNSNTKRHSWITYRLGEFYLDYAEAVFRYLGSADATSSEFSMSARNAVNIIRNRTDVKMPALATGLSNSDFWQKYENERMVELAFEGHRFWDVRRWKEGSKLASIVEMHITKNDDGSFSYNRVTVKREWNDKMYLFPIPQSEMLKHSAITFTQNPGWE
jgi:hypothetical protein